MAYTFPQLKQIRDNIVMSFGISSDNATRVVAFYNVGANQDHNIIDKMLSGDLSSVPAALSALGIPSPVQASADDHQTEIKNTSDLAKKTQKKTAKSSKKNTSQVSDNNNDIQAPVSVLSSSLGASDTLTDKIPVDDIKDHTKQNTSDIIQSADGDILPTIDGDIITPSSVPGLPDGFGDVVEGWLADWSIKYKIDLVKASGQQWRSACIYVGSNIQRSGVLIDRDKMKRGGSKYYSPEAALALLYLWEYITGLYRHIPLVSDFIAFTGASREWFYDTREKGLSSSRVELLKKARAIEEAGISAGIIDGRENPTGRIFYSKARLGWRESVEIVHTSAAPSVGLAELPKLDIKADLG